MKAITLWQPWATLVAHELKRFETRSWSTTYRGPLAIHAAKRKIVESELNPAIHEALAGIGYYNYDRMPYGCIVCIAEMTDCIPAEQVVHDALFRNNPFESYFGDFSPGRFAWRFDQATYVDYIPARGSQGFWEWTPPDGSGAGRGWFFSETK